MGWDHLLGFAAGAGFVALWVVLLMRSGAHG
jgi:hypothetical protein